MEFKENIQFEHNEEDSLKSEMLDILNRYNIRLDSDYKDQHILISREVIEQLIDSAKLTSRDSVLEIGPGPGQITEIIARNAGRVYAVEIDERFRPILENLQKKYRNLEIIFDSILNIKWPIVNKIVSNPPFSILEPLIERLVKEKRIELSSFIISEKYYQRCSDFKEKITKTSLIMQTFFDIKLVSKISGNKFFPESRESSVIIKLLRKNKRKSDFDLRLLVSRMINTPNESVVNLLRDIINEKVNLRTTDYRNIPTVKSLNIPDITLRKSLRDLNNMDIAILVKTIKLLKKRF